MSRYYRDDRGDNSVGVGILGLIFGFVAGATAVILSDPDRREKVIEKTNEIVDKARSTGIDSVNKLADTVKEKTEKIQTTLSSAVENAEKKIDDEIAKTESKDSETV